MLLDLLIDVLDILCTFWTGEAGRRGPDTRLQATDASTSPRP
jgi:hypothetical protein